MVSHNFVVDTVRVYLAGTVSRVWFQEHTSLITILAQIRPDFIDRCMDKVECWKEGSLMCGLTSFPWSGCQSKNTFSF